MSPEAQRPPRGPRRVVALDVLRGVAILLVLVHHMPVPWVVLPSIDPVLQFVRSTGWVGVDLFFVLSGFLVGGLVLREIALTGGFSRGRFYLRRLFRIWPAYLVHLVAFVAVSVALERQAAGGLGAALRASFARLWPAFLHIQNYFESTSALGWMWSLGVEEHFYLVLPVGLALALRRRAGVPLLFLAIASCCTLARVLTRIAHPTSTNAYDLIFPTHLRLDSLLAGVLLVHLSLREPAWLERLRPHRKLLAAFAVVALLVSAHLLPAETTFHPLAYALSFVPLYAASFLLVASAHLAPDTAPGLALRGLATIGQSSYSIYIWHGFFGPALANRLGQGLGLRTTEPGLHAVAYGGVYLVVCIGLGAVMHRLVEYPALNLRDRLFPRRE